MVKVASIPNDNLKTYKNRLASQKIIRFFAFCVLFALLASCAKATTPIVVDVSSKDGSDTYTLNTRPISKNELQTWMRETIELFGAKDYIIVRPDSSTTIASLFELLQTLAGAGVKHIEILVSSDDDGKMWISRYITLSSEQIVEERGVSFKDIADKEAEKNRREKEQKDTDALLKTLRSVGQPPQPK